VNRVICYGGSLLMLALGLLITPESCREVLRLQRLSGEGRRVAAQIVRIEEERAATDSEDRPRYGRYRIIEHARVQYSFRGRQYESRHGLPEPTGRHKPGDAIAVIVLPDEPARSYATHEVAGSWFAAIFLPPLLVALAVVFAFAGGLFGRSAPGDWFRRSKPRPARRNPR
jgi:hypothetical protein